MYILYIPHMYLKKYIYSTIYKYTHDIPTWAALQKPLKCFLGWSVKNRVLTTSFTHPKTQKRQRVKMGGNTLAIRRSRDPELGETTKIILFFFFGPFVFVDFVGGLAVGFTAGPTFSVKFQEN